MGVSENKLVFVHGAWGRSDDWDELLTAIGDRALCRTVDLPSAESAEAGLGDDVKRVHEVLDDVGDDAVLVGHSYGGMVITDAVNDRVRHLVFIAAFVPEVGQSMFDIAASFPPSDEEPFFVFDETGTTTSIKDWASDEYLQWYTPEAVEFMRARPRRAQSLASAVEPCTNAGWLGTPSTYLLASRDRSVPPEAQRTMSTRCNEVIEFDADHFLWLGNTEPVAELLVRR